MSMSVPCQCVPCAVLTLVLGCLVFGHASCTGEELEADVTLNQSLQLPGVVSEHVGVVGPVVVPQTGQLLWKHNGETFNGIYTVLYTFHFMSLVTHKVSQVVSETLLTHTHPYLIRLVAQVAAERLASRV